jgi:chemotaxis protein CheC
MADLTALKERQLDALRETANIGAGHAATALSQMTNSTIMITVPTITIAALEDVPSQIEDGEEPIAAVLMHMMGDLTGRTLLVFPRPTQFYVQGQNDRLRGFFLLLPDVASLQTLLRAVRVA